MRIIIHFSADRQPDGSGHTLCKLKLVPQMVMVVTDRSDVRYLTCPDCRAELDRRDTND